MKKLLISIVILFPLIITAQHGVQKYNKAKWPFTEARKCADYYKDLSDLPAQLIKIYNLQMSMEPYKNDEHKIDSLMKQKKKMINLLRTYSDSSYYFYKIVDGN